MNIDKLIIREILLAAFVCLFSLRIAPLPEDISPEEQGNMYKNSDCFKDVQEPQDQTQVMRNQQTGNKEI